MKLAGYILLACVALATLKAAIAALLVAGTAALVWGALFRPAQTFGLIGLCVTAIFIQAHAWAMTAMCALAIIANRWPPRDHQGSTGI